MYFIFLFVQFNKKRHLIAKAAQPSRAAYRRKEAEKDCIQVYNKAIKEQEKAKSCTKRHKNLPSRRLDIHYPYLLVKLTGVLDRIFRAP